MTSNNGPYMSVCLGWQPKLSIKDKKLQMNRQNVDRKDR